MQLKSSPERVIEAVSALLKATPRLHTASFVVLVDTEESFKEYTSIVRLAYALRSVQTLYFVVMYNALRDPKGSSVGTCA